MSESDSTKVYNNYVRANLPNGMSYDTGTGIYDINNHSFFTFKNSNWYYKYISKYGYSASSEKPSGSAYSVIGFEPALVFDFKNNYYRKSATDSTFAASMTHTASSNATMFDSDGLLKWRPHNIITQSNTFSTWTKNYSYVVANNAVGPNGTANTASTVNFAGTTSNLYNLSTVAVTQGDKITLAAWVRSDTITSLTISINGRTQTPNNVPFANKAVTSTWTLVTFEASVQATDTGLYFIFGHTGSNAQNNQIGDLEIYGAHMYRSDLGGMVNNPDTGDSYVPTTTAAVYGSRVGHHIYNGTAWVNEGILHESEARTNLFLQSNGFGTSWNATRSSVTAAAGTSPSGLSDAWRWTNTSTNALFFQPNSYVVGTHTVSAWVKSNGAGKDGFRLWGQNTKASSDFTATSEWVRYSFTFTITSAGAGNGGLAYALGTNDVDVLVYGLQLEAGSTPSSYISTSGSAATRSADLLTVPAANLPYSSTNMSIQMAGKMTYADTDGDNGKFFSWHLDNSNNIYSMLSTYQARTGAIYWVQESGNVLDAVTGPNTSYSPDTNVPFNFASRHGSTFLNGAIDGTALTANTTPTALPNLSSTNLILGDTFMGTIGQFRMWSDDLTGAGIAEAST